MARIAAPLADNPNPPPEWPPRVTPALCPRCGEGGVPDGLRAHDICPRAEMPSEAHDDLRVAWQEFEASASFDVDSVSENDVADGDVSVARLCELYNELRSHAKALNDAAHDVVNQAAEDAARKRGEG